MVNRFYPEDEGVDSPAAKRASVILNGGLDGVIDDFDGERESDDGDAVDVVRAVTGVYSTSSLPEVNNETGGNN